MTLTVAEVATVAWDYTMADLEAFARKAARLANAPVMSREDAADTAWHGIVEALYTATEKPPPHQLIGAGVTIVQRERRDWYRHHGVDVDHPGRGDRPAFTTYWGPGRGDTTAHDGFSDRVVERMALPQVLAVLTARQYEVVVALAAFDGDARQAAAALGITLGTLQQAAQDARQRILGVWFEHETPRFGGGHCSDPDRCRNGHLRAEHSYTQPNGALACRECRRRVARNRMRRVREAAKVEARAAALVS